jgi:S-DNA-T family DNA segregation ATPase FtsK/SpoIIIE
MIDEFADLIMQDRKGEIFNLLCRIAQKSRASQIYCILATQRPTVDIINGTIKSNFPARIACKTASAIDSRIILDENGAENLCGAGDSLIKNDDHNLQRFQAAWTSAENNIKYLN